MLLTKSLRRGGPPIAFALFTIASLSTYARETASQSVPQFRSGTEIVRIEAMALDGQRRPVRGLTETDFTLLVDGKAQPIEAFATVDLPDRDSTSNAPAWARTVAPDITTNTVSREGRLVVILFDRSIPPGQNLLSAKRIATAAVDQLAPGDLAAIVNQRGGPVQNFTADRALLMRAITGAFPGSAETEDEAVMTNRVMAAAPGGTSTFRANEACVCNICVMEQIGKIAETLRSATRPKLLFFIGSEITVDVTDIDPSGGVQSTTSAACFSQVREARRAMDRAVDAAHLTVYSIDPAGLPTGGGPASSSYRAAGVRAQALPSQILAMHADSLKVLPTRTGGRTIVGRNQPEQLMPDLFAESASYYVVGFRPPDRTDRVAKIELRVKRAGVTVQGPRTYDPTLTSGETRSTNVTALRGAITSTMASGATPLTVSLMPLADPAAEGSCVLVVLNLSPGLPPASASADATPPARERIDVALAAYDSRGRLKAEERRAAEVTRPRENAAPYELVSRINLRPGTYELRVGTATGGVASSVFAYVDVPDFAAEPLSLSGVALNVSPKAGAAALGTAGSLLPFLPTAQRTFSRTDSALAFLRIYQGGQAAPLPAEMTARVTDSSGAEVMSRTAAVAAVRFTSSRVTDYSVDLPLASMAPGEFLLTVEATAGRHKARRDVRFVVR